MGHSSSRNTSSPPKILGSHVLAVLAQILWPNVLSNGGLIHDQHDVDLHKELDAMKKTMLELTKERDKARDEIQEKSVALAAVQQERDGLSGRMEELNKRSTFLAEQIGALNDQLGQEHDQTASLKQQLDRHEKEKQIVMNELAQIKTKHSQTVTLLDTRTSELKGAQAFLTKADSMSGADVVRMVEGLDAEILQTAAFMADHFVFGERQDVTEEMQGAIDRLGELLGPKIVDLLGRTEHANDPTLIQLACQASTTAYCRWIIVAWDFDDPNYDNFLKHIYMTVQKAEDQAVSGRWRALTRTHVQSMLHGDADVSLNLVLHIADTLADVLLVAGLKATHEHIHEEVMTTFGEKLTIVVRAALALNWVIGKDITSADLEPITVLWQSVFDSAVMEDVNGGGLKVGVEHVLCTTDLGLQRVVKSSKEGESEWQTSMLLKPKVALESMIEGLQDMKMTESPAGMDVHELPPNGHT